MDYQEKYIKYKLKYLNLKSELSNEINGGGRKKKNKNKYRKSYNAGRSNESYIAGINYEGGKIIQHIKQFKQCVAYANCQIAMDAPFQTVPRVADEKVRSSGRSESQFHGYDEDQLKDKLLEIFSYIKSKYPSVKIVIQIARGRSSEPTFVEVIKPVLDRLDITNILTKYGYRSTDYFVPTDETPFVFVNYGMFAELSDNIKIQVGEICNPVVTYDVLNYDNDSGFEFNNRQTFESDDMNILNNLEIKKLTLFGIADSMKFVTPTEYKKEHVLGMVDKV